MSETTTFALYRDSSLQDSAELSGIQRHVPNSTEIEDIPAGSTVFPRFRAIPFGQELETAVLGAGSTLVNSWSQYEYISDLFSWASDLGDLTPGAYRVGDIATLPEGEYFIKGETNSVKHEWLESAFAPDLEAVHRIVDRLSKHSVVGSQQLVIRPFVRYRQLAVMESGQPVFNEHRVFVLHGKVVASGFYWSQQRHRFAERETLPLAPAEFERTLERAIERIGTKASFVVLDLAERTDGTWDVIELNDGNMSGLCGVDPIELWRNIAAAL